MRFYSLKATGVCGSRIFAWIAILEDRVEAYYLAHSAAHDFGFSLLIYIEVLEEQSSMQIMPSSVLKLASI